LVDDNAHEIAICALGPLTNIALALEIDPELPQKVAQLTLIGGAFGTTPYAWSQATGDNPTSEWNVFVDPEAAKLVFHAGFRLLAVGLDVTTQPQINFRESDLHRLRASSRPEAKLALRVVEFVQRRGYQSYCSLIDSAAVACLIEPSLVTAKTMLCDVETEGRLTRGMTVVERRAHHAWEDLPRIDVAVELDECRFLDLVTTALTK
jgi:purine nucleosidase/pyrimidine-specific ribonucleoside hydrolase